MLSCPYLTSIISYSVWVNVIPPDGVPRRFAATPGESLLDVLQRNRTPGIYADCGGGDLEHTFAPYQVPFDYYSAGVSCAQCHVIISDPFLEKTNPMPSTETRALDRAGSAQAAGSRLACCVQIRPELNEMICVVADNKTSDGDWFSGRDPSAF